MVQYLVKPVTEDYGRCRFADLPCVKPFTGPATVFVSHCWGGRWGDLVAAACAGAEPDRKLWIDIFAVLQWPGNFADLDFRAVIHRCRAVIVAVAPLPGTAVAKGYLGEVGFNGETGQAAEDAYLKSKEYAEVAKVLAFARLWCIGERPNCVFFLKTWSLFFFLERGGRG